MVKTSVQCRRPGFNPWVGKIPWRRKWQPTPVLLPGKFHGQRSLQISYSPWNHKESHTTEQLHVSACMEAFNTQVSSLCPCLSSPFCTQRAKAEHMGPSQISPKCTRSPRLEQAPSAKTKLGAFQSFYFPKLFIPQHFLQNFTGRLLFPIN